MQNKQRKVTTRAEQGEGRGTSECLAVYFFPFGEKNYRLLLTMCSAGHKCTALEMVRSMFCGCGDQGELIQW